MPTLTPDDWRGYGWILELLQWLIPLGVLVVTAGMVWLLWHG